jgi:hypothetical protein
MIRKRRWIVRTKIASGVRKPPQAKWFTKHGVADAFYDCLIRELRVMEVSNTAHWVIGEVERA